MMGEEPPADDGVGELHPGFRQMPKPRPFAEQMPPGGWPLRLAIIALAPALWRDNANLYYQLGPAAAADTIMPNLLWQALRERIGDGDIELHGLMPNENAVRLIEPSLLRRARPNFEDDSVVVRHDLVITNVSLFPSEQAKTGLPGRPTTKHLWRAEFAQRTARCGTADTLKGEAEVLAAWMKQHHPTAPQPSARTIENEIRADFAAAKQSATKPPTK